MLLITRSPPVSSRSLAKSEAGAEARPCAIHFRVIFLLFSRRRRIPGFSVCEVIFVSFLTPSRIFPSSANGAPIHFLNWEKSRRASRAQSVSLLTHTLIILALAVVAFRPPIEKYKSGPSGQNTPTLFPLPANFLDSLCGHRPTDGRGSRS